MNSLLRFRPLAAVLVALTVFAAACGGDDDAVIAGADADTVIASLADRELTAGMLDDLLPDGSNTVPSRIATVVESWLVANALELELAERGFPITDEDRELAVAAVGDHHDVRADARSDAGTAAGHNGAGAGVEESADPAICSIDSASTVHAVEPAP